MLLLVSFFLALRGLGKGVLASRFRDSRPTSWTAGARYSSLVHSSTHSRTLMTFRFSMFCCRNRPPLPSICCSMGVLILTSLSWGLIEGTDSVLRCVQPSSANVQYSYTPFPRRNNLDNTTPLAPAVDLFHVPFEISELVHRRLENGNTPRCCWVVAGVEPCFAV